MPTAQPSLAVDFSLPTPTGVVVSLSRARLRGAAEPPVSLLFVGRWDAASASGLTTVVSGVAPRTLLVLDSESSPSDPVELTAGAAVGLPSGATLLLDTAQEVARAYGITEVPTLVELTVDGRAEQRSLPAGAPQPRPLAWRAGGQNPSAVGPATAYTDGRAVS